MHTCTKLHYKPCKQARSHAVIHTFPCLGTYVHTDCYEYS